jgi:hypothetical protein
MALKWLQKGDFGTMRVNNLYPVETWWRHCGVSVGNISFIVEGMVYLHDFNK